MAYRKPNEALWRCSGCNLEVTGDQDHSGCMIRGGKSLGTTPAVIVPPEGNLYGEIVSKALFVQNSVDQIDNAVLGIAGEAGEIADLFKKRRFHPKKDDPVEAYNEFMRELRLEIGDVLFYLALLNQNLFGDSLLEVARDNLYKLQKRWPENYKDVNLTTLRL